MFKWFFSHDPIQPVKCEPAPPIVESLEDRQLLSGHTVHHHVAHAHHVHHASHHAHHASKTASTSTIATTATATAASSTSSTSDDSTVYDGQNGRLLNSIQFSQAPTAVQNGLDALATTDNVTAPGSTQTVFLGNSNGVETYTIEMASTGTITRLTVDQNGNPVTQPTESTTTWDVLSGTGTGSNSKAAAEITAIATALKLTAPTSTTVVDVSTAADGTATYTVRLSSSSSTTTTGDGDWYDHGTAVSVDSNGNPVGHQELPFSVLPSAIQNGINSNLPSGTTALAAGSTQTVDVLTANGVTFYSTTFTTSGTSTTVTVDSSGKAVSLPSTTTDQFQNIPAAAQTELQTLATANGVSGTISATQSVTVYNEGNGTTIYRVTLSATDSSTSQTFNITVSVDQAGNPTVPPHERDHGGCGGGDGGFGGDIGDGGDFGFGFGYRHGSD